MSEAATEELSPSLTDSPATPKERAFPSNLRTAEDRIVEQRRAKVEPKGKSRPQHKIGVALSGGGIRSATFALGFFQALAKNKVIRHIDYLSTVSGGGYFGGFLGALYRRNNVKSPAEVETVLSDPDSAELRYLRENGRYLAPSGKDDLYLGAAVLARNWVAIQVVILSFLLFVFLLLHSTIFLLGASSESLAGHLAHWQYRFASSAIWLSPWLLFAAGLMGFGAVPLGISYWTIERHKVANWVPVKKLAAALWPVLPYVITVSAGLALALYGGQRGAGSCLCVVGVVSWTLASVARAYRYRALLVPFLLLITGVTFGVALDRKPNSTDVQVASPLVIGSLVGVLVLVGVLLTYLLKSRDSNSDTDRDDQARHAVSSALKVALIGTGLAVVVGLIDTVAGTVYWALASDTFARMRALWGSSSIVVILTAGATVARRVTVLFSKKTDGQRMPLPLGILANVVAAIVLAIVLVGVDLGAHTIANLGNAPHAAPAIPAAQSVTKTLVEASEVSPNNVDLVVRVPQSAPVLTPPEVISHKDLLPPLGGMLIAFILSVMFGSSRVFLNRSSHHALYSSRITRAYLGASNPKRFEHSATNEPAKDAATQVMNGDDFDASKYFGWRSVENNSFGAQSSAYAKGAPLHIVNVTINETVDGRSQVQQDDRHGLMLALGPCGVSAGVQQHVILAPPTQQVGESDSTKTIFGGSWEVFKLPGGEHAVANYTFPEERLTIGEWLGISGAAFSTGLGSRTNMGLSLLAGMANVRLGYWWKPGVKRTRALHQLWGLFWVQTYLFRELLASFPGTANALWYLSDGGHFENMGAYELIRRRTKVIVVVDAEEDPDYQFEGLANLVRKARLDFGAEITFLPEPRNDRNHQWQRYIGSLDHLRRGKWVEPAANGKYVLQDAQQSGVSKAHAAIAEITYRDSKETSMLLYVKPTLIGEESRDVENYHQQHPAFPHEPTSDQFFGEDQWESYRKIGEDIGLRLHDDIQTLFRDTELL